MADRSRKTGVTVVELAAPCPDGPHLHAEFIEGPTAETGLLRLRMPDGEMRDYQIGLSAAFVRQLARGLN